MISIEKLVKEELLSEEDIGTEDFNAKFVEYGRVIPFKEKLLRKAYQNFIRSGDFSTFEQFQLKNSSWLDLYAIFSALKLENHLRPWYEWSEEFHTPTSNAVVTFAEQNMEKIDYFKFIQFKFDQQWQEVRSYASSKNIKIIGDIPIFVAYDSADTFSL